MIKETIEAAVEEGGSTSDGGAYSGAEWGWSGSKSLASKSKITVHTSKILNLHRMKFEGFKIFGNEQKISWSFGALDFESRRGIF